MTTKKLNIKGERIDWIQHQAGKAENVPHFTKGPRG